jgi:UDP-galactose transporter B1
MQRFIFSLPSHTLVLLMTTQSGQRNDSDNGTPRGLYALCAVSNLISMVCSNMALRWVAYPVQVVAKSAKPIPVMVLGVLLGRKSYPLRKYCYTLMIVLGVAVFMYKSERERGGGGGSDSGGSTSFGQFLIISSLFMNGITGVIQDKIRSYGQPSATFMMMSLNKWSSLILTAVVVLTGEWRQFLAFTARHPEIIKDLILLSSLGAFGQFFIFMMISNFGSLPCSIVTTVRKLFAVLFSLMVFGNSLSRQQWCGTILVFAGLFADMLPSRGEKKNIKIS